MIGAAQDSDVAAARRFYAQANTEFPSLIDTRHRVSALYDLVNVPAAVWIDEGGQIVRIDSGAYVKKRHLVGVDVGSDRYLPALRDWVAHGASSRYARAPEDIAAKLAAPTREEALAEASFALGAYFQEQGDRARANAYWERAQELAPDNWNYYRQDWSFSSFEATAKFLLRAVSRRLRGKAYYAPLDLPESDDAGDDVGHGDEPAPQDEAGAR